MQEIIVVVIMDQMTVAAVKETQIMVMEMEAAVDGYSYQLFYSYVADVITDLVEDLETTDQAVDLETTDQEIVEFVMDQTALLADATRK